MTQEEVTVAFTSLSGEEVLEVSRLIGNSSSASWRVATAERTYAVRLYRETDSETEGPLEALFAYRQAALLRFLESCAFPVPPVQVVGL